MKKIEAFIKSIRLPDVMLALHAVEGMTGMTITEASGFGGQGADEVSDFNPVVRVEIFCKKELTETIVSTIEKTAHTGLRGDGKIYVMSIEGAVRISTGERGQDAV